MAWLWRGAQSAAFYYLSCAPCSEAAHRRARKRENRRAAAALDALAAQDPERRYIQPPPTGTNEWWREEINLGPALRKAGDKARGKKSGSKKRGPGGDKDKENKGLDAATDAAGIRGAPTHQAKGSSPGSRGSEGTTLVDPTSSDLGSRDDLHPHSTSPSWASRPAKKKRYQRPDEILWGFGDPAAADDGDSRSRTSEQSYSQSYAYGRNPEVNDLHPPIVSTAPRSSKETRWMLQPPPPAKVMEGKVRETELGAVGKRSRKGSVGTGKSAEGESRSRPREGSDGSRSSGRKQQRREGGDQSEGQEDGERSRPIAAPDFVVLRNPPDGMQAHLALRQQGRTPLERIPSERHQTNDGCNSLTVPPPIMGDAGTKTYRSSGKEMAEDFKFPSISPWEEGARRGVSARWSMDI